MRKLLAIAVSLAALSMGGCATQLAKVENAWTVLNQTTVPASYALVTANAFDGIEAGATAYLKSCVANLTAPACSAANRRTVIKNIRVGRSIRNQIETYITTSTTVPVALFDSLHDIVDLLNTTPAANFGAAQ